MRKQKKRKRLLSIFAAAAVVVSMNQAVAFADEGTAATIGARQFDSLESAIGAAEDGETIQLKNGTYTGNFVIDKAITIVGESKEATIIAGTEQSGDIIHTSANVTLENLTIDGKKFNLSPVHKQGHGIYAERGLTVNNVDVINIGCSAETPICGCQTGVAIYIGSGNSENVTIQNVNLKDFQKAGIVSKTSGDVLIENVNIAGIGETDKTAQNGIQINNSKTASINNSSISGISYAGDVNACGVLLVDEAEVEVNDVVFEGVKSNVSCYDNNSVAFVKEGDTVTKITAEDNGGEVIHKFVKTEAKPATCTENGNIEYWYCEICDEYYADEAMENVITEEGTVVKAAGHDSEVKNAKEATCLEEGYTGDKVCKVCGEVEEEGKVIPKLAHSYKDGKCTVCGTDDPDYKPAGRPGTRPEDKPTTGAPKTGDNSNMIVWGAVMLMAGAGMAGTIVYSRKRRRSR